MMSWSQAASVVRARATPGLNRRIYPSMPLRIQKTSRNQAVGRFGLGNTGLAISNHCGPALRVVEMQAAEIVSRVRRFRDEITHGKVSLGLQTGKSARCKGGQRRGPLKIARRPAWPPT